MKKWMLFLAFLLLINKANSQIVVICTGEYARVYHSRENCTGLNNCRGEIIKVYQSDAINKYKLQRPCCVCWYPSPIGCSTDDMTKSTQTTKFNPYVSEFSSEEEMKLYAYANAKKKAEEARAIAAAGALAFASIAGSNDFYIHLLKASNEKNYQYNQNINSVGLDFGFRLTNNNSAFEYGASLIQDEIVTVTNTGWYISSTSENKLKWGAHLSYLYNFHLIKNSDKLNAFIGVTANSFFSKEQPFGIGGVGGLNLKLLNWLKLDTRFEKSNTTNRFLTGLIITYNGN
jgi:hypothetical protein